VASELVVPVAGATLTVAVSPVTVSDAEPLPVGGVLSPL